MTIQKTSALGMATSDLVADEDLQDILDGSDLPDEVFEDEDLSPGRLVSSSVFLVLVHREIFSLLVGTLATADPPPKEHRMIEGAAELKSIAIQEPRYEGWLRVPLSGIVEGIDVHWNGWTGQKNTYDYDREKYKGIIFQGDGRGKTVIRPGGSANMAVSIGAGNVAFEGVSFECGVPGGSVIWTSGFGQEPVWLTLRDFEVTATGPVKWTIMTHNTDDYFEEGDIHSALSREHASYAHGHAEKLSYWKKVYVHSAGAECDKRVARPEEKARFFKDMLILRDECVYADFHQAHSPMGGGFVCQGAAAHVRLADCLFRPSDRQPSKSLMLDDSYKLYGDDGLPYQKARSFDIHTGTPMTVQNNSPEQCANGFVFVERCAIEGLGGQSHTPMVRVGPQGGGVHKLAQGFGMFDSGVYGANTKVELIGIEKGPLGREKISVTGCNTPGVKSAMWALGYEAQAETMLAVHGRPWTNVSAGFSPLDPQSVPA